MTASVIRLSLIGSTMLAGLCVTALPTAADGETTPVKSCPLPAGWVQTEGASIARDDIDLVVNVVEITADGQVLWNGLATEDAVLEQLVGLTARMSVRPVTAVVTKGATCERVDQVRSIIAKAGCDNGACLDAPNLIFDRNSPPPPPPSPPTLSPPSF